MAALRITGVFLLALVQYGMCSTIQSRKSCNQVCPFNYLPVCGSDGKIYINICSLEKENCASSLLITKQSDNSCFRPDIAVSKRDDAEVCNFECPDEYAPVCGSNWHTFNNECELKKANCTSDYNIRQVSRGVCKIFPGKRDAVMPITVPTSNDLCNLGCNTHYRPMCGSDGKTYSNYCEITILNCRTHHSLHIHPVSEGLCVTGKRAAGMSCPEVCPMVWKPVCGSDGISYSNECALSIKDCQTKGKVTMVSTGACVPTANGIKVDDHGDLAVSKRARDCNQPFACTADYDPVCGSDGRTYSNMCGMNADCNPGLTVAHMGECRPTASDITLGDLAVSKRARDCSKPIICFLIYDPVCGSDGRTYSNKCAMDADCSPGLTVAHMGECSSTASAVDAGDLAFSKRARDCSKPIICIFLYDPVCGSDGRTYSNKCFMDADCSPGLTVAHMGECSPTASAVDAGDLAFSKRAGDTCPLLCTEQYQPVCGSDGKTYSNGCFLGIAHCHTKGQVTMASTGPCDNPGGINLGDLNLGDIAVSKRARDCNNPIICMMLYYPVCGSDGKTYSNPCNMDTECTGITMASKGPCGNPGDQSN